MSLRSVAIGHGGQNPQLTRPLIAARGLCKSFDRQDVLRDLSFELHRGQVVVIRGPNGSGKTTLLNILSGGLKPDMGELQINTHKRPRLFRWPASAKERLKQIASFTPDSVARLGLGRMWQDLRLFDTLSVLDNVCVATPRNRGENPLLSVIRRFSSKAKEVEAVQSATAWLSRLDIDKRATSYCDQISFGQMKRVAMARLMQAGSTVLMMDEPLAGLDATGRHATLRYIKELIAGGDCTLLVVEHVFNLADMLALATDVWTLHDGVLTVQKPRDVLDEVDSTLTAEINLDQLLSAAHRKGTRSESSLEILDISVRRGHRQVLKSFTMRIPTHGIHLLAHSNGWGKTTLLDAIAGLLPIQYGQIVFRNTDITHISPWRRARLGMVYLRSRRNIIPKLTVHEHSAIRGGIPTIASTFSEWNELMPEGKRYADSLSGGEKQRLAIGSLPVKDILLLDEPFLNLDGVASAVLQSILLRLNIPILVAVPSSRDITPAAEQQPKEGGNGK